MKPSPKQPERETRHRAKKDRKRWCKGVVGRAHKPVLVRGGETTAWRYEEKVCEVCNKCLSWRSSWWTGK